MHRAQVPALAKACFVQSDGALVTDRHERKLKIFQSRATADGHLHVSARSCLVEAMSPPGKQPTVHFEHPETTNDSRND